MEIKDLIRQNRLNKNYTLVQLADLLGCKHSTISAWENGLAVPGPKYLQRLKDVFGADIFDINESIDNNDIVSEPLSVYEKTTYVDKLVDSIQLMAKNNEKLVSTNELLTLKLMRLMEKLEYA